MEPQKLLLLKFIFLRSKELYIYSLVINFFKLRYPVIAMGIMKWIASCFSDRHYHKVITDSSPFQVVLLDEVYTLKYNVQNITNVLRKWLRALSYSTREENNANFKNLLKFVCVVSSLEYHSTQVVHYFIF